MKRLFSLFLVLFFASSLYADITPLPDPPQRTDPANFSAKADAFLGALPAFGTETNALAVEVEGYKDAAAASATAANISSESAASTANFSGVWSTLTGSLTFPASVYHSSQYWQLTESITDVTAEVPGVSAKWIKSQSGDLFLKVDSIADLRAITYTPEDGQVINVLGYTFPGDGGNNKYYWDAYSSLSDNAGSVVELASSPATGRFISLSTGEINVKQYGLTGDGVTNDFDALANMLLHETSLFFPEGHYILTSGLIGELSSYNIRGANKGKVILDFSQVTSAENQELAFNGVITQLPALAGNLTQRDREVEFVSAHGLDIGDLFFIHNTADYSFSGHRAYYRQGEMHRVYAVIDATTVDIGKEVLYADYNIGVDTVNTYKIDPVSATIKDLTIYPNPAKSGLSFYACRGVILDNVDIIGGSNEKIIFLNSYDMSLSNMTLDFTGTGGTTFQYNINIASSQNINIDSLWVRGLDSAITSSKGDLYSYPSRNINVSKLKSDYTTIDLHGDAEFVNFSDCIVPGGITVGGDHCTVNNCQTGGGVSIRESRGYDYTFQNNQFNLNEAQLGSSLSLFTGEDLDQTLMRKGGTLRLINNTINANNLSRAIYLNCNTGSGYEISYEIKNNTISNGEVAVRAFASEWKNASIKNNTFDNADLVGRFMTAKTTSISNNVMDGSQFRWEGGTLDAAITPFFQTINIDNNTIKNAPDVMIVKASTNLENVVKITNNIILDNLTPDPVSDDKRCNLFTQYLRKGYIRNNTIGYTKGNKPIGLSKNFTLYNSTETGIYYLDNNIIEGAYLGLSILGTQQFYENTKYYGRNKVTYASGAPAAGSWSVSDVSKQTNNVAGGTMGYVCITAGTFGAATDSAGDTDGSTNVITGMADTSDFNVGDWVNVSNGFPVAVVQILDITSSSEIIVSSNSDSAQSNITIDTTDPVFKTWGAITP